MAKIPERIPRLKALAARDDEMGTAIPWDRLSTQSWQPATCSTPPCEIEQYRDDDDPSTVVFADVLHVCEAHAVGPDPTTDNAHGRKVYEACRSEDRRWMRAVAVLSSVTGASPQAAHDQVNVEWSAQRLADGIARIANITIPTSVSEGNRASVAAFLNAEFGAGAVIVTRG